MFDTTWLKFLDSNSELGYVVLICISLIYFYFGNSFKLYKRLFASSHGLVISCSLLFAGVASKYTHFGHSGWIEWAHLALILIGLISILFSIWLYRKKWYIHILHILTVSYGFLFSLYGGLAISHDSF